MSRYQDLLDRYEAERGPVRRPGQATKIIGWVSYASVPEDGPERIGGWGGFIQRGDRWRDYIETCHEEEVAFHEALRHEILGLAMKRGGDWHQNDPEGVPVFADGTAGMFSFRAWGDLMAAIWAEHEDRDYSYMDFYMESCIPSDRCD